MTGAAISRLGRALALTCALGALSSCGTQRAEAQASPAQIALSPGATCLELGPLVRRVGAWLGERTRERMLRVAVHGSPDDPRSVRVSLHGAEGELSQRTFSPGPAACTDLHDAVALAIALMIKTAEREHEPRAGALEAPAQPAAEPDGQGTAPRAATIGLAPPPRLHVEPLIALAGVFALYGDASIAGGAEAEVGVTLARVLDLRAGGLALFAPPQRMVGGAGSYALQTLAGSLALCAGNDGSGQLRGRACALFWAGRTHATGADFARSHATDLPWLSAGLKLELAFRLYEGLRLTAAATPTISLRAAQLVARDEGEAVVARASLPRFGALFALGLSYGFAQSAR